MENVEKTRRVRELGHLARTEMRDGMLVTLRCYEITNPKPRFELVVAAHGEAAVVDVPSHKEQMLELLGEHVIEAFVASARLREDSSPH